MNIQMTYRPDNILPILFTFDLPGKGERHIHHSHTSLEKHGGVSSVFQDIESIITNPENIRKANNLVLS